MAALLNVCFSSPAVPHVQHERTGEFPEKAFHGRHSVKDARSAVGKHPELFAQQDAAFRVVVGITGVKENPYSPGHRLNEEGVPELLARIRHAGVTPLRDAALPYFVVRDPVIVSVRVLQRDAERIPVHNQNSERALRPLRNSVQGDYH